VKLAAAGLPAASGAVAEIGPGESVGTGLAALIAGAERYVGLDVKNYALRPDTLALFDELVALFRDRAPIPGGEEFRTVKPELGDDAFPGRILNAERMARALDPARLAGLRGTSGRASRKARSTGSSRRRRWSTSTISPPPMPRAAIGCAPAA
jgi:hypothetical protein